MMDERTDGLGYSRKLIEELGLVPLSGESGYIGYISTSQIEVTQEIDGKPCRLKANGSIYYLLNKDRPMNYLHWLSPDDTHILLQGGPVHYYEFRETENKPVSTHHLLGANILKGERPVLMIPGGSWKALILPVDVEYALLSTILTPQWSDSPDRLHIGAGEDFIKKYVNTSGWATEEFLLKLIGPNYGGFLPHN